MFGARRKAKWLESNSLVQKKPLNEMFREEVTSLKILSATRSLEKQLPEIFKDQHLSKGKLSGSSAMKLLSFNVTIPQRIGKTSLDYFILRSTYYLKIQPVLKYVNCLKVSDTRRELASLHRIQRVRIVF